MGEQESKAGIIAATVNDLLPHYSDLEADAPANILRRYPRPRRVIEALQLLLDVMFPGKDAGWEHAAFDQALAQLLERVWELLTPEIERALPFRWLGAAVIGAGDKGKVVDPTEEATKILGEFYRCLSEIRALLVDDIRAAYDGDPAALTYAEITLAYPGLLAIASHRLAHELYRLEVPILPRVMSEWTHSKTGVDIHPGARIGRGFFIDHATGVVIGETATIGDGVKLYQGVTLGARSFELDSNGRPIKSVQRHPTVEDDVVIYAHATILGGDTVIGKGSIIGGNVFITESVPPYSTAVRDSIGGPKIRPTVKG